jgi:hypothetical protein
MYESPFWTGWAAESWGVSWGGEIEIYAQPVLSATGHNAPPLAQHRKRRGITRRRGKLEEQRKIARRQDDEAILLLML